MTQTGGELEKIMKANKSSFNLDKSKNTEKQSLATTISKEVINNQIKSPTMNKHEK